MYNERVVKASDPRFQGETLYAAKLWSGYTLTPSNQKIYETQQKTTLVGLTSYDQQWQAPTSRTDIATDVDASLRAQYNTTGVRIVVQEGRIIPVVDVIIERKVEPLTKHMYYQDSEGKYISDETALAEENRALEEAMRQMDAQGGVADVDVIRNPQAAVAASSPRIISKTVILNVPLDVENPFVLPTDSFTYEIRRVGNFFRAKAIRIDFIELVLPKACPVTPNTLDIGSNAACRGACGKMGYKTPFQDWLVKARKLRNLPIMSNGVTHVALGQEQVQLSGCNANMTIGNNRIVQNGAILTDNTEVGEGRSIISSGSPQNRVMDSIAPQSNVFFPYPKFFGPVMKIANTIAVTKAIMVAVTKVAQLVSMLSSDDNVDASRYTPSNGAGVDPNDLSKRYRGAETAENAVTNPYSNDPYYRYTNTDQGDRNVRY